MANSKLETVFGTLGVSADPRLAAVWADMAEFCRTVNLAFATGAKLEPVLFQEMMVSVQYRLLHMRYGGSTGAGEHRDAVDAHKLHEAVRLAMLAFATTVFMQIAHIDMRYAHLASGLEAALRALEVPLAADADCCGMELRVWLLLVANTSLPPSPRRAVAEIEEDSGTGNWLETELVQALRELGVASWAGTREILKRWGLWIDMVHDRRGKNMLTGVWRGLWSAETRARFLADETSGDVAVQDAPVFQHLMLWSGKFGCQVPVGTKGV